MAYFSPKQLQDLKCLKIFNKMLLKTELKLNPSGNCQVLMLEICQCIKQLAGKKKKKITIFLLNIYSYKRYTSISLGKKKKPNKRFLKFF